MEEIGSCWYSQGSFSKQQLSVKTPQVNLHAVEQYSQIKSLSFPYIYKVHSWNVENKS